MKYIPADKLIAEIERRMTENCELAEKAEAFGQRAVEDNDILALIDSLQQEQPEVDLEKAYKSYIESRKDDLSGNAVTVNMKDFARHFYELGLNARKNE